MPVGRHVVGVVREGGEGDRREPGLEVEIWYVVPFLDLRFKKATQRSWSQANQRK